ncbi:hypothetical protein [Chryseobacterium phosphatilyticum]|uniref:hypothetical protein n=1 Tax=Chryseobacterium phosphatilyticum TaxID=475075 RepID=UPI001403C29C|nr:hypothetical protein [Chryseobacterium phosphatilyticum]
MSLKKLTNLIWKKPEIEKLIRDLDQLNSEAHNHKYYSEKGKNKKELAQKES